MSENSVEVSLFESGDGWITNKLESETDFSLSSCFKMLTGMGLEREKIFLLMDSMLNPDLILNSFSSHFYYISFNNNFMPKSQLYS